MVTSNWKNTYHKPGQYLSPILAQHCWGAIRSSCPMEVAMAKLRNSLKSYCDSQCRKYDIGCSWSQKIWSPCVMFYAHDHQSRVSERDHGEGSCKTYVSSQNNSNSCPHKYYHCCYSKANKNCSRCLNIYSSLMWRRGGIHPMRYGQDTRNSRQGNTHIIDKVIRGNFRDISTLSREDIHIIELLIVVI